MSDDMKTGLIGLGIMGSRISANLSQAGMLNEVYDRKTDKAADLSKKYGIKYEEKIENMVKNNDVIITVLYNDDSVNDVYERLIPYSSKKIFIDMSTISPETSISISDEIREHEGLMYDAPVIGTSVMVEKKTVNILVGGDHSHFPDVKNILEKTSANVIYIGNNGYGLYAKIMNNLFLGSYMATLAESFTFGQMMGLDDKTISEIFLKFSNVRSPTSELKVPKITNGDYSVQFSVKNMLKDLEIAQEEGRRHNIYLPESAIGSQLFRAAMASGYGDEDMAAVFKIYKSFAGKKN
ncbi:MAG: NAD(P)-dependent oxidoreductase [Thermoplasmata archaeon]